MQTRSRIIIAFLAATFTLIGDAPGASAAHLPQDAVAKSATTAPPKDAAQTASQKMLTDQAKRLVDMATDLKAQVAKTNKNILSLDVVRKAEEIETLAHRMKEQAKPSSH